MIIKEYFKDGKIQKASKFDILSQRLRNIRFKLFGEFKFIYWLFDTSYYLVV